MTLSKTIDIKDWETSKVRVAKYITARVLPKEAHTQVIGVQERRKPLGMGVKEWWYVDQYLTTSFQT